LPKPPNRPNAKLFIDARGKSKPFLNTIDKRPLWVRLSKPFRTKTSLISFSPFSP